MTFLSPEGIALATGSVYVTLKWVPAIAGFFATHRNGNGTGKTEQLLTEIAKNTGETRDGVMLLQQAFARHDEDARSGQANLMMQIEAVRREILDRRRD